MSKVITLTKQQIALYKELRDNWFDKASVQKSINRHYTWCVWYFKIKNEKIPPSQRVGSGVSEFNNDINALINAGLMTAKGYDPESQSYKLVESPMYVFNPNAVRSEGETADKSTWMPERSADTYNGPCATTRTKTGRLVITLCNITRTMDEVELFETVETLAKLQGIEHYTKIAKEYIAGWKQENFIVKTI